MDTPKLKVSKRNVLGRKVKNLRKGDVLPANIYGKKIKSLSVQVAEKDFLNVYRDVGETGIIDLAVEGEKEKRPVLVANFQLDYVSDRPLHIDFRQVILTEKTTATIPVELTDEAPAVGQKLGILIQQASELEVEALPKDLPDKLIVSIAGLAKVGDAVYIKDIKVDKKIDIKADPGRIIARIEPPTKEEEKVKPTEEEVVADGEEATVDEKPGKEEKAGEDGETQKKED